MLLVMRIVSINLSNAGSTGNIMKNIGRRAEARGHVVLNMFPQQDNIRPVDASDWIIQKRMNLKLNSFLERILGLNECLSVIPTLQAIRKMQSFEPDLIHLHNIHGSYINLQLLFQYLLRSGIPVIWTLHDCWPFTGRCPYFCITKCDKWQEECHNCPYPKNEYPRALIDTTKIMHKLKKQSITRLKKLTIVTPSEWLANLAKQSFLKDYPIRVINNGIDLQSFKPRISNFRDNLNLEADTFLVLGVSFSWGTRKGLDVFIRLAEDLPSNYRIILVGTNETIEKLLPKRIISIRSTNDQEELAEIYSSVDVFVNPTREDNFPTVNIESLACGTPVITFQTGGSPEIIDELTGAIVEETDYTLLVNAIRRACEEKKYSRNDCINRVRMKYDMYQRFDDYVNLYEELTR